MDFGDVWSSGRGVFDAWEDRYILAKTTLVKELGVDQVHEMGTLHKACANAKRPWQTCDMGSGQSAATLLRGGSDLECEAKCMNALKSNALTVLVPVL